MPGYFPRQEFKDLGLSERAVRVLEQLSDFVDTVNRVAATESAQAATDDAVAALQEADEDAAISLASLDSRIDHFEALEPLVRQDQGAAWTAPSASAARSALPAYAAPTISAAYTQSEVQAIATQLAAVTSAVAGIITDCKANGVLT